MVRTNKRDNGLSLLKKGALLELIRKNGISRVSPEVLELLNERVGEDVVDLVRKLRQYIQVRAKKTVGAGDVVGVCG